MALAASRTDAERKPSARRSPAAISPASFPRASSFLANALSLSLHGLDQGGDLAVPQAVGAAVGYEAGGGGRDVVHDGEVVLPQRGAGGGKVHNSGGEAGGGGGRGGAAGRGGRGRRPVTAAPSPPRGAGWAVSSPPASGGPTGGASSIEPWRAMISAC